MTILFIGFSFCYRKQKQSVEVNNENHSIQENNHTKGRQQSSTREMIDFCTEIDLVRRNPYGSEKDFVKVQCEMDYDGHIKAR